MKTGQKVKIVSCNLHPEFVGKEGIIVDTNGGLYKVMVGRKIIPDYATEDCLIEVLELDESSCSDFSLNTYQEAASTTNTYPDNVLGKSGLFMGLSGEAGEATDKAKKEIRDHIDTAFQDKDRNKAIAFELGDALWYISQAAKALGYTLSEIADLNLVKLADRAKRDQIHGEGDYR